MTVCICLFPSLDSGCEILCEIATLATNLREHLLSSYEIPLGVPHRCGNKSDRPHSVHAFPCSHASRFVLSFFVVQALCEFAPPAHHCHAPPLSFAFDKLCYLTCHRNCHPHARHRGNPDLKSIIGRLLIQMTITLQIGETTKQ